MQAQLEPENYILFSALENDKIARFLLQPYYAVAFSPRWWYHYRQRCRVLSSLGGMKECMDALPGGRAFLHIGRKALWR